MTEKYDGWTNWDTWNANLRLSNDEVTYNSLLKCSDAKEVRLLFLKVFGGGGNEHDGIDYGCVNWYEIYDAIEK